MLEDGDQDSVGGLFADASGVYLVAQRSQFTDAASAPTATTVIRRIPPDGSALQDLWRGESDVATPSADFRLDAGDVLVVVGQPQQIKSAQELLTGAVPT